MPSSIKKESCFSIIFKGCEIKTMFTSLKEYYKERDRLVREAGMDYIDACNKAWREVMNK